jgi:hypothetical protein
MNLPKTRIPRRAIKAASRDAYRCGAEHGRRWGSSAATAEEIARIAVLNRENATLERANRRIAAKPLAAGVIAAVRFTFLVRPGIGEDVQVAAAFWREVLGDAYAEVAFDDMAVACEFIRGFANGSVEGHRRRLGA